jgi:hypothetical protein
MSDKRRCEGMVWGSYQHNRCMRSASRGAYCYQHDPKAIAEQRDRKARASRDKIVRQQLVRDITRARKDVADLACKLTDLSVGTFGWKDAYQEVTRACTVLEDFEEAL